MNCELRTENCNNHPRWFPLQADERGMKEKE
jgi:hypothetical protein